MKKLVLAALLILAALVLVAIATAAKPPPLGAAKACTGGVSDRIAGRPVCIHVGGRCLASHNARYRARGFTCVGGRLRRLAKPSISIADAEVAEGNTGTTTLAIPVRLSAKAGSAVSVGYATSNGTASAGSDYTAASGTLVFKPGETQKAIQVTVAGDTSVEQDETITVTLSSPTGAKLGNATATATIRNDDTAPAALAGSYQYTTSQANIGTLVVQSNGHNLTSIVFPYRADCQPPDGHIIGVATTSAGAIFPIAADLSFTLTGGGNVTLNGSIAGKLSGTLAGRFDTAGNLSGTAQWHVSADINGTHYECDSGALTFSGKLRT